MLTKMRRGWNVHSCTPAGNVKWHKWKMQKELEIEDREDSSCVVEVGVMKAEEGLGGAADEATWLSSGRLTLRSFLPWSRALSPCATGFITVCVVCILRNQHKHKHSVLKLRREHCYCSVAQSCPTLTPMDCSTPGFPALHHLLEFAQTQVH